MMDWLRSRFGDLSSGIDRWRDTQTAEAIVAIMCGATYADGQADPEERQKFAQACRINPVLKQYEAPVLLRKWEDLAVQCEFDHVTGLDACEKELRDISGKKLEQREMVLKLGMVAARAKGGAEPSPEEMAWLTRCARTLGVEMPR
jgi:tellurite resistance protein